MIFYELKYNLLAILEKDPEPKITNNTDETYFGLMEEINNFLSVVSFMCEELKGFTGDRNFLSKEMYESIGKNTIYGRKLRGCIMDFMISDLEKWDNELNVLFNKLYLYYYKTKKMIELLMELYDSNIDIGSLGELKKELFNSLNDLEGHIK
jgi:hypothetical protein